MFKEYLLPVLVSLLLHAGLAGFVFSKWEAAPEKKMVTTPKFIEAKLVELKPKDKKKASNKKKPQIVDLTKRKQELERKKRLAAEQRKKKQLEKKRADEKRKKEEAAKKKREEEKRKKKAEADSRERQRQQELSMMEQALLEEQDALIEEQFATDAQSYASLIQKRIEQNWSRPPSARNGMRCELVIEMVPNGRVMNVNVTKSSGNSAFDRSALAAVKKVEVFPEVKNIPIEVFERHFRKFSLGFQPEDLRQ